ncbi:MAG: chemotaxis protein CheX [Bdellovibrio sp.]|nr:chemotaxis protein CheX [Bdellovibrio sp.]
MDQATFNKKYVEFTIPFVKGLQKIYSTMLRCEIKPLKPELKKNALLHSDHTAVMGMNGYYEEAGKSLPFRGSLLISWPEESYLKMASAMLGTEYKQDCEEIADAGSEICNMTMGAAKSVLVEIGYRIEMSIPTAIAGLNHQLQTQKGVTTILLPFESSLGNFFIEINFAFNAP